MANQRCYRAIYRKKLENEYTFLIATSRVGSVVLNLLQTLFKSSFFFLKLFFFPTLYLTRLNYTTAARVFEAVLLTLASMRRNALKNHYCYYTSLF